MCVCIKDKKSCFFLFLYDQRRNVYTKSPLLFASIHPSPRLNKKKNKTPKELEKKVNHSFPSSSSIYTLVDTCKCGVTKWASQSRLFSFFFSLCVWSKMTRRSSPAGFFFFLSSFLLIFICIFLCCILKGESHHQRSRQRPGRVHTFTGTRWFLRRKSSPRVIIKRADYDDDDDPILSYPILSWKRHK